MGKLITGGLVGGAIVFIWGMISWMVLPWHNLSWQKFTDATAIEQALVANAPHKGIYMLPNECPMDKNLSPEEKKALQEKNFEKMKKGPFAFIVMNPNGIGSSMPVCMAKGLLIQILSAFFMTLLLLKSRIESYGGSVIFTVLFALAAGIVCYLPSWNWWGFPTMYTLVEMADLLAAWFLAGLILAKITSKQVKVQA